MKKRRLFPLNSSRLLDFEIFWRKTSIKTRLLWTREIQVVRIQYFESQKIGQNLNKILEISHPNVIEIFTFNIASFDTVRFQFLTIASRGQSTMNIFVIQLMV